MKKLFILTAALLSVCVSFGQRAVHTSATPLNSVNGNHFAFSASDSHLRTSSIGDTLLLSNILAADTPLVIYTAGSAANGYLTGTDTFGDQGFAERYDLNGTTVDSSIVVLGVVAEFHGKVNPLSTHFVTFKAWSVGVNTPLRSTIAYSGFPQGTLAGIDVPFTQLGIGTTADTIKAYLFAAPTVTLQNSFFVGYSMSYNFATLAGDTIGLACSVNGDRTSVPYTVYTHSDTIRNSAGTADSVITTVSDTTVNVQNATQWSDGIWHDNYSDNDSLFNNLAIYPIAVIGNPTGLKGITRNNLTFFGNFPNPAASSTNIRFSLLRATDVSLQVMDMNGRVVNSATEDNLSAGEHTITFNTSALPAGEYIYIIHTSAGDGIASKMVVAH